MAEKPLFWPGGASIRPNEHPDYIKRRQQKCQQSPSNPNKSKPEKKHLQLSPESLNSSKEQDEAFLNSSSDSSTSSANSSLKSQMLRRILERNKKRNSSEASDTPSNINSTETLRTKNEPLRPLLVDENFCRGQTKTFKKFDKIYMQGPMDFPQPFTDIESSYLHPTIKTSLISESETMTKLHSYVWPAILRGLHVCTITNRSSSSIYSYLPPLLQLTLQRVERDENCGLVTIIVTPFVETCKKIFRITKKLLPNDELKTILTCSEMNEPINKKCRLLITTPKILLKAIKSYLVDTKHLSFMTIEEAYLIFKELSVEMKEILEFFNNIVAPRHVDKLQMILNSERWSLDLTILLKHLRTAPFLYFENYLEASWYGQIEFQSKKLKRAYNQNALEDTLRRNAKKTIVFCDEYDVGSITENLRYKGFEVSSVTRREKDILELENCWINSKNKIMVCSDEAFKLMPNILDASLIVHYSLPNTWNYFVERCRCYLNNLPYIFEKPMVETKVYLFLEEEYQDEILYNFQTGKSRNIVSHLIL